MSIIGSIQARMGSTRLPGKVLKKIEGKPLLLWQIERIRRSRLLDNVIVATTTNQRDDVIADLCRQNDIDYFRGSENDVLDRIAQLIETYNIDTHVEFFGDSPLIDPHIIDEIIGFYLKHCPMYDFVSNSIKTTYPPGQEVLIYKGNLLRKVNASVLPDSPDREHTSVSITQHPEKYKLFNIKAPYYYHYPEIYLEVDTIEDFEVISNIIAYFVKKKHFHFSLAQILDYLDKNKKLTESNKNVERRWKEFR